MTPELERAIARLRDWHTRSAAATDPDQYPRLLGEGEACVRMLLEQLDREGATDGQ